MQKTLLPSNSAAALSGPKIRSPAASKCIDDAGGQRAFRAHDGQFDVVFPGELGQGGEIIDGQGDVFAVQVAAGVAWGDEDPLRAGALRDFPSQGVFAPAIADDQYVHRYPKCRFPARLSEQKAILVGICGSGKGGGSGGTLRSAIDGGPPERDNGNWGLGIRAGGWCLSRHVLAGRPVARLRFRKRCRGGRNYL